MSKFEQSDITYAEPGKTMIFNAEEMKKYYGYFSLNGKKKVKGQLVFQCPYKHTDECPLVEKYAEDKVYYEPELPCNKSPVVLKENGDSICDLMVDLNDPEAKEKVANLGNYLEFRTINKEE